jgi:hypothetical protein
MNEARRMVYDFMNLPHHVQIGIFKKLGLIADEDLGRGDMALFVACFRRAREGDKIEVLRNEIAEAQPVRCHAAMDGDCYWSGCPQLRDGEPQKSGRHCPLDAVNRQEEQDEC